MSITQSTPYPMYYTIERAPDSEEIKRSMESGEPIKLPVHLIPLSLTIAERESLMQSLIQNRSAHKHGAGMAYWESVVDLVDKFIQNRHEYNPPR